MRALVLAVVGIALLATGVVGLAVPVSVDDGVSSLECGSAFTGVDETPGLVDAGRDVSAEIEGYYGPSLSNLAGACEDKIALRRVWGWPVTVIGLALVGWAVASRVRSA